MDGQKCQWECINCVLIGGPGKHSGPSRSVGCRYHWGKLIVGPNRGPGDFGVCCYFVLIANGGDDLQQRQQTSHRMYRFSKLQQFSAEVKSLWRASPCHTIHCFIPSSPKTLSPVYDLYVLSGAELRRACYYIPTCYISAA